MAPTAAVWSTADAVAASCGTLVKVWTPNDPASEIKIFEGTAVYSIDFSRNNKVLAVAGDKGQVVLYSNKPQGAAGERAVGRFPGIPQDGADAFTCVRFSSSDAHLLGGCNNGTVHIWALKQKEVRAAVAAVDTAEAAETVQSLCSSACSEAGSPFCPSGDKDPEAQKATARRKESSPAQNMATPLGVKCKNV